MKVPSPIYFGGTWRVKFRTRMRTVAHVFWERERGRDLYYPKCGRKREKKKMKNRSRSHGRRHTGGGIREAAPKAPL